MTHPSFFISRAKPVNMGLAIALAAVLGISLAQPSMARDHGESGLHRRDVHQNQWKQDRRRADHDARDRHEWRRGYWRHGRYEGRMGWWWVTGNNVVYYSRPIYPYPTYPYAPDVVYAPPVIVAPPPEPSSGINFIFPLHIR